MNFRTKIKTLTALALFSSSLLMATPSQVLLIRRGEGPKFDPNDKKTTQLSTKGKERALAMVPFFMEDPRVTKYGPPKAIYVQKDTEKGSSFKIINTVKPLAEALKVEPNSDYLKEYSEAVKEILDFEHYQGKTVLFAASHEEMPDLIKQFGIKTGPSSWPDDAFDRVWIITFNKDGTRTFENLPQRLLFGDSEK